MHNSYFHIAMVIMGDECLLSQQGSRLAGCTLCVCVCTRGERMREDVQKGEGGKVSGDTENVLKDRERERDEKRGR